MRFEISIIKLQDQPEPMARKKENHTMRGFHMSVRRNGYGWKWMLQSSLGEFLESGRAPKYHAAREAASAARKVWREKLVK